MPELEFGVPPLGDPPGTCELLTLAGAVLLGGVEGAWYVEISRADGWQAMVWPPGALRKNPAHGMIVPARPSVEPETELIEAMIWAAQEAYRIVRGGGSPEEVQRRGYEADDAVAAAVPCNAVGRSDAAGRCGSSQQCVREQGHEGPHSWEVSS